MKLIVKDDHDGGGYVLLTMDEEYSLAQSVMDAMVPIWVDGVHYQNLRRIYLKKTAFGRELLVNELYQLVTCFDFYGFDLPNLVMDGKHLRIQLDNFSGTKKEKLNQSYEWINTMTRHVWREVWEQHEGIKKTADEFKWFWGDRYIEERQKALDTDFLAEQDRIEEEFWEEVRRVQQEYVCSKQQAIILVSDYQKRGDYKLIEKYAGKSFE